MAKKAGRHKHVPQRTCIGCRLVLPKRSLVRVVRSPQGVQVDPTGKMPGRGAYLHDRCSCWEKGLKGSLAQALKATLTDEEREKLSAFAATLSEPEEISDRDKTQNRLADAI